MKDKEFSQSLDLLRFPLALMVVVVHVFSWRSNVETGWEYLDTFRMVNYARSIIKATLADTRVPFYFFMAGYFFFKSRTFSINVYIQKLRNRVHSLLIPYILWISIAIVIVVITFIPPIGNFQNNRDLHNLNISISSILNCFWNYDGSLVGKPIDNHGYPLVTPLWFVRDLMIVVVTTPLLHICLKYIGKLFLVALGLLWFFYPQSSNVFGYGLTVAYFFFSLGGFVFIEKVNIILFFRKQKYLLYLIYISCSIYLFLHLLPCIDSLYTGGHSFTGVAGYIFKLMTPIGILCFLSIADQIVTSKIISPSKFLSKIAFFIYVGHALIQRYFMEILWKFLSPNTDLQTLGFYILSFLLLVAMIIVTYMAMQKVCPGFLRLLSGGRSSL
ncbi:MAG: acyltransferase [Bacteroides sp.]|nr:acyltransferase [Bacteroides sp.]